MPAPSASLDTAALRKARGAFFTPEPLARYVTEWGVRSVADKVLEPSCGEAAFLLSAVDRLAALHDAEHGPTPPHLDGVELHDASAAAARDLLRAAGVEADVRVGDFFTLPPTGTYDAVIGNPPYVRYQDFAGESRARSREAALRAGVPMSNLASSWAAFTVHAALFLRRGGRLVLVLPAPRLRLFTGREDPAGREEQYERLYIALVDANPFKPSFECYRADNAGAVVTVEAVLDDLVHLLAERNFDSYEEAPTGRLRALPT